MVRWRSDQQIVVMDVDTGDLSIGDESWRLFDKTARAIRQRTRGMSHPRLDVRIRRQANPENSPYQVEMEMELLGRTLSGAGQGPRLNEAILTAGEKILSQIGPLRAAVRRAEVNRLRRRAANRWAEVSRGGSRDSGVKEFEQHLEGYWRPLVRQVARQIAAMEMNRELPRGEITAQDVVDEVIVRAHRRFAARPSEVALEVWLYRLAREVLEEQQARIAAEQPISAARPRAASHNAEPDAIDPTASIEDYYTALMERPFRLRADEEIVEPAGGSDPSVELSRQEMREALDRTVAAMPAAWREALWLHYLDGFDVGEIAALQQTDEQQARENLRQAARHVRDVMYGWREWDSARRDETELRQG